jgi:DNA-binding CsgD family transcriptional regulator/PAS domain-containing protein
MIDEYDRLICLIYDGVMDDAPWSLALAQVADFIGAVGVGLGMQDMQTHEFRSLGAAGISAELNPTYQRLAPDNRIWQEIARRREPLTDRMVMPKDALVRTELYADWFRPQDFHSVMAYPALFKHSASAVVVAFRSRTLGDFEAADLARLGRFADHFGRALTIRLDRERTADDLARAQLMLDAIEDAILLVDQDLRVRHANAAARAMLDAGKAIRLHKGRLEVNDAKTDAKLARILAGGWGGELRPTGPALTGMTIQVHPCVEGLGGGGAGLRTVRITDLNRDREQPTPARLRDRLGLTSRQAQVAAELARGVTEAEAAAKLELGAPTLHTHVRRIYEKLDLRSRAELMALLGRHGFHATLRPK